MDPRGIASDLRQDLRARSSKVAHWDRYYEGKQGLAYMHPELLVELGDRVKQVVVNWPRLVVDALEERLDVEGFRLNDEVSDEAWRWWQANSMDVGSQQAHLDALLCGRSYVIVGSGDDPRVPLITVESAEQVYAHRDPRTRAVNRAVKAWRDRRHGGARHAVPARRDRCTGTTSPTRRRRGWTNTTWAGCRWCRW